MKVQVKRIFNCSKYCIGQLYVDGNYICDTIEDTDRLLDQSLDIKNIYKAKVPGRTAIPTGTYKLTVNIRSPKFSKYKYYMLFCHGKVPRLLSVPGFDGILIHRGVDQNSSNGCIIVGYNKVKGKVENSQEAFEKLYNILKSAKDLIEIEITRKF